MVIGFQISHPQNRLYYFIKTPCLRLQGPGTKKKEKNGRQAESDTLKFTGLLAFNIVVAKTLQHSAIHTPP